MKKILSALIIFTTFSSFIARADEGMWLPLLIERLNYVDMEKMGCHLTAEEIYSVNHACLKDAIVQFGNGCTGEVISNEGLIITNHHCGYGSIQANSSVDHDYLTDGFWATSKAEELPNEGLTVTFLIRIEDVSQKMLAQLTDNMTEARRTAVVDSLITILKAEATKDTKYDASVKSFFDGNEYYLFVYEIFKDVRLVGAPPESIGSYGGDTDNWMWPRHTCDFSMFRVYADADGNPAAYSKSNVALKPKHSLPVSIAGYKEDDFAMILGYPGSTDRFLTSYGVKLALDETNPAIVKIRDKKLELMKTDMDASTAVRIKYSAKYKGSSNYWKYYIGQSKGLKALKVYDDKVKIETAFETWANSNASNKLKYGTALTDIAAAYVEISKYAKTRTYYSEALLGGCEIIRYASRFEALYNEMKKDTVDKTKVDKLIASLKTGAPKYFKDYDAPTDRKIFAAMLTLFYNDVAADYHPDVIKQVAKKYKNNFETYASDIFLKSMFANEKKVEAFLAKPSKSLLEKDPCFKLMLSVMKKYREVTAKYMEASAKLSKGNRLFVAGLMAMDAKKVFYPNANSTMRLTYGKVLDYFPADAVHYNYFTTLKGVMEKADSTNEEFIVPAKLKELYKAKDYGKYAEDGELKVCFLTDNDITGGNSGSPVINGDGQLIGLAFDGNWEAMSGNIAYNPKLQRTICVDIRYVLFIIDNYAGASNLIEEMNIVAKK